MDLSTIMDSAETEQGGTNTRASTPPLQTMDECLDNKASAEAPVLEMSTRMNKLYNGFLMAGLHLSFYLANYQFTAFTATLTSEWNFSLLSAVITTNIQGGLRSLLVILVAWPAEIFLGNRCTRIFSAILYTIGVTLLYGIYPSLIISSFLPGLLLITLAQCGYDKYVQNESANYKNELEKGNHQEKTRDNEEGASACGQCFAYLTKLAVYVRSFVQTNWIVIIGLSVAVFLFPVQDKGLATIKYMLTTSAAIYAFGQILRRPLMILFQFFSVAFKKRNNESAQNNLAQIQDLMNKENTRIWFALKNPHRILKKAQSKAQAKWRELGNLWEEEIDIKQLVRTMSLSSAFLMYGVMSAVGDSYFVEQVDQMNTSIGNFQVPTQVFVIGTEWLRSIVKKLCHWLYSKACDDDAQQSRFYGTLRVGLGMLLAIPCFFIASLVESKRLDEDSTSVLWLFPQLIIMATVDGLAMDGIECFFEVEMPAPYGKLYASIFAEAIVGLGKLLSVAWNFMCHYISQIYGHPSWFGDDINESRLDIYYVVMALFAVVSFIVYVWIAYKHSSKRSPIKLQKMVTILGWGGIISTFIPGLLSGRIYPAVNVETKHM